MKQIKPTDFISKYVLFSREISEVVAYFKQDCKHIKFDPVIVKEDIVNKNPQYLVFLSHVDPKYVLLYYRYKVVHKKSEAVALLSESSPDFPWEEYVADDQQDGVYILFLDSKDRSKVYYEFFEQEQKPAMYMALKEYYPWIDWHTTLCQKYTKEKDNTLFLIFTGVSAGENPDAAYKKIEKECFDLRDLPVEYFEKIAQGLEVTKSLPQSEKGNVSICVYFCLDYANTSSSNCILRFMLALRAKERKGCYIDCYEIAVPDIKPEDNDEIDFILYETLKEVHNGVDGRVPHLPVLASRFEEKSTTSEDNAHDDSAEDYFAAAMRKRITEKT